MRFPGSRRTSICTKIPTSNTARIRKVSLGRVTLVDLTNGRGNAGERRVHV